MTSSKNLPCVIVRHDDSIPPRNKKGVIRLTLYIGDLSTNNFENRLPFELQYWVNTLFKGFVKLSSLLINVKQFGFFKMV